jgi:sugar phosphate isomerase/epimerase
MLEMCRAAGFIGIEGIPPFFEAKTEPEVAAIGDKFKRANVLIETFHLPFSQNDDIASFYEERRLKAVENMRVWMARAVLAGASICIQHPTTNRGSAKIEGVGAYMKQLAKSMKILLREAERQGVILAMENITPLTPGRFGSTLEHLELIGRELAHPNFGMCLDTGHALMSGGPAGAAEFAEIMSPHLVAFHIQDNAGDRDSHLAPGHGNVDWESLFKKVAETDFKRTICIEAPPFAPGPDYSVEAWKNLWMETDVLAEKALA